MKRLAAGEPLCRWRHASKAVTHVSGKTTKAVIRDGWRDGRRSGGRGGIDTAMFHEKADLLPQPLVDRHQVGRLPRLVIGPAEVVGAMQLADQLGRRGAPHFEIVTQRTAVADFRPRIVRRFVTQRVGARRRRRGTSTTARPAGVSLDVFSAGASAAWSASAPPPQAGAARDKNSRPASAGRPGPAFWRSTRSEGNRRDASPRTRKTCTSTVSI